MAEENTPKEENKEEVKAEEETKTEEKNDSSSETSAKEEAPAAEVKEEEKAEVPAEFKELVEKIENLSVLQLAELVKVLEGHFGVSAAAPVAVAAAGPTGGGEEAAEEAKSSYNIMLTAAGDKKIDVIKAVREISGLGLAESKAVVDSAPKMVKEDVPAEDAEAAKKALEEAGATVELQ